MAEAPGERQGHWLTLESAASGAPWGCRIDSVGVKLPAQRLTTKDLMSKTSHSTRIQLERLTGIHERRVVGPGENSFTLATGAARDCLSHSQHRASDIEMLISTSITRSRGRFSQSSEPPLSLSVKQAIGAAQAVNFDLSNACAGMLTGVFILQDFIARGEISCGMVVSGDCVQVGNGLRKATARRLADAAARHCFAQAGRSPSDIDMLINVGTYREDNMGEPTRRFLHRLDLEVRDVDLLVPAPSDPDFLDPLRARLGIPGDRVAYTPEDCDGTYTTGPIAALQAAATSGRLEEAGSTLLLAAGPGVTVALALYRQTGVLNGSGSS